MSMIGGQLLLEFVVWKEQQNFTHGSWLLMGNLFMVPTSPCRITVLTY